MSEIELDKEQGVGIVTLAAPERENALTAEMSRELSDACHEIDEDLSLGAAVIRAEGEVFCGGANPGLLTTVAEDPLAAENLASSRAVYQAFRSVGELKVPTVVAVRGKAFGGGLNLMLAAEVRIVADDALLLSGFTRVGIHAGGGHFAMLGRAVSRGAAAAIGLFDRPISGATAVELGLAWAAPPAAEVDAKAIDIARRPASDPELARAHLSSFRTELGPPAVPWEVGVNVEANAQLWSLSRFEPRA